MAEINTTPSTKKLYESMDTVQNEQKFGNGVFHRLSRNWTKR